MTVESTQPPIGEAPGDEKVYEDYFGFDETLRWFFPDGKQYIEFHVMNEGQRAKFQKLTNKDITLRRQSGDASIKVDPAEERYALLTSSVIGWLIYRNGDPVPFSSGKPGSTFEQWLDKANPKLVDDLEFTIRKANPWMQADMSVEQIDEEIDRLTDLRKQAEERQRGEGVSSSR
jgi:hypothetical protein